MICQYSLEGKELFYFENGKIGCQIDGCDWEVSCDVEDPLGRFARHLRVEHLMVGTISEQSMEKERVREG